MTPRGRCHPCNVNLFSASHLDRCRRVILAAYHLCTQRTSSAPHHQLTAPNNNLTSNNTTTTPPNPPQEQTTTMAEEPQPPTVSPGADADAPDVLPANAEDRKAAAALSSLDAKGDDNAAPEKEVDLKALDEAMKNLDFSRSSKKPTAAKKEKDSEAPKPLVKVNPADVALLVEHLDLSKAKATDLLRAHDANAEKAMMAWVSASV